MPTPKKAFFAQFAQIAKAMSNANRLEMLEFLAQKPYSVEELAKLLGLSIANTSHHLQQLRHTGLVMCEKRGQFVYYQIAGNDIVHLLSALRSVGERHSEEVENLINTYLTSRDSLEALPREELISRMNQGAVIVLDVRPEQEFAAGHIPGALNIKLQSLDEQLKQLTPDQEIVAYCRGPQCLLAFDAVKKLREMGYSARRLEDGFPEWKANDLPVEKGS